MKRLLPWILLAPFLVCNVDDSITGYMVNLDSAGWVAVPAPLRYDLQGIDVGEHTIEVKAKNMWGESSPVPFSFTKTLPALSGIRLSED